MKNVSVIEREPMPTDWHLRLVMWANMCVGSDRESTVLVTSADSVTVSQPSGVAKKG